ncbi:MAG: septum formation inhibitor Maf [Deltaproteobacteria bacterium]|nr:septum formation inhibitor Maf [Deltaproteobacteria bacterium]
MGGRLILASASPRRRELLDGIGLDFEIIPSGVDEEFREGESPREHVMRLAREKAFAVSRENPHSWVLGADTEVVIDGDVLGKPDTHEEAREMLNRLIGRMHLVITGFSIAGENAGVSIDDAVESQVFFKEMSHDEIEWYIKTGEPYDKAGGYAIQGKGALFVKEIRGSHTNVIGLPLCEVLSALENVGAVSLDLVANSFYVARCGEFIKMEGQDPQFRR